MAAGELWNVGIILYTFYQGEFPFKGETDEQIIDLIVNRPNNWMPLWREGTSEQMKNFIMMCLKQTLSREETNFNILIIPT